MNKNKVYLVSSIVTVIVLIAGVFLLSKNTNSAPSTEWKTYHDEELGITFDYPPQLDYDQGGGGEIFLTSNGSGGLIRIQRSFGFGGRGTIEDIMKQGGLDSTTQTIQLDGRTGVITKSIRDYSPDDNSVYILVDDALFFVGLNGIDLIKFFNGIKITKPQILSGYKIISEKNHKTFINPKRGYQIDIPNDAGVSVRAIRTALGGSSGVIDDNIAVSVSQPYFGSGPNSGIDFIITVASSSEQSVQGMINARNMTFEKNIVVDGAKAYLSHVGNLGNSFDEYSNEKVVYILKDGTLYLISVQSADYKEILAGFRFLR